MQLSVNLTGGETAVELRTLAAILAAMYGTPWLEAVSTRALIMHALGRDETAAAAAAVNVTLPPTGGDDPDPATIFTPPAADVFKPATGEAGNDAPIAAAPVGMPAAPPPAPAASAPSGVELDIEGLPWDGRIHSSAKSKTANGKWKGLRSLNDEAKVNAIKAELRAAQAAPRTATPPAVPVPPVPQPPAAAAGTAAVPPAPGAVPGVPGVSAVAAPVAPSGDAEAVTTFPRVMKKISALRVGQFPRMSAEELQAIMTGVGLPSLPSLASRTDLIPDVAAQIDALMLTKLQ